MSNKDKENVAKSLNVPAQIVDSAHFVRALVKATGLPKGKGKDK